MGLRKDQDSQLHIKRSMIGDPLVHSLVEQNKKDQLLAISDIRSSKKREKSFGNR